MNTFKDLYKSGVKVAVDFIKQDGTKRHMICQRDSEMESQVQGSFAHKSDTTLRVVEITESDNKQWRSVPLDRIEKFEELSYVSSL